MNDRIFGFITLGVSVFYFWAASITELSFISDPVGPKKFPYMVAFFLAVSSLVLIFLVLFEIILPSSNSGETL